MIPQLLFSIANTWTSVAESMHHRTFKKSFLKQFPLKPAAVWQSLNTFGMFICTYLTYGVFHSVFIIKGGTRFWIFGKGTQKGSQFSKMREPTQVETMWMSATRHEAIPTADCSKGFSRREIFKKRPGTPWTFYMLTDAGAWVTCRATMMMDGWWMGCRELGNLTLGTNCLLKKRTSPELKKCDKKLSGKYLILWCLN